jgi:hypothetical protein
MIFIFPVNNSEVFSTMWVLKRNEIVHDHTKRAF